MPVCPLSGCEAQRARGSFPTRRSSDLIREDGDSGEWQDWLVDESPDQETTLAVSEKSDEHRNTLPDALDVVNVRERRIFEMGRLADEQNSLAAVAEEYVV